jgi:hypothetical protein
MPTKNAHYTSHFSIQQRLHTKICVRNHRQLPNWIIWESEFSQLDSVYWHLWRGPWQWLDEYDESMSHTQMFEWHARFRAGETSNEDDQYISSTMPDIVAKLQQLIHKDRCQITQDLAGELRIVMGCSKTFWLLNWVCIMSLPILFPECWQLIKSSSVKICKEQQYNLLFTADSWIYGYGSETK